MAGPFWGWKELGTTFFKVGLKRAYFSVLILCQTIASVSFTNLIVKIFFHVDKKGFFMLSSVLLDFSWAQFSPNGAPFY